MTHFICNYFIMCHTLAYTHNVLHMNYTICVSMNGCKIYKIHTNTIKFSKWSATLTSNSNKKKSIGKDNFQYQRIQNNKLFREHEFVGEESSADDSDNINLNSYTRQAFFFIISLEK